MEFSEASILVFKEKKYLLTLFTHMKFSFMKILNFKIKISKTVS